MTVFHRQISLGTVVVLLAACGCGGAGPQGSLAAEDGTVTEIATAVSRAATVVAHTRSDEFAESSGRGRQADTPETAAAETAGLLPDGPTEDHFSHLHNLLQVSGRIYSGGEPEEDQAFAELAELGVRTVVSVDGARPNLEAAERHGLRYVHIPIGYDGIDADAGRSLTRLVRDAEGPFYIHCHHGKHRGPAAAAVACIADGATDGIGAHAVLKKAGTSPAYAGLWRDVQDFNVPADGEPLPRLVSAAEVGSLAAAMAQVGRARDHLKLCRAVDWRTPAEHPDLVPSQAALLLREGLRETVRQLKRSNAYDARFLQWMQQAEVTAADLQSAFEQGQQTAADDAFAATQDQCRRCHVAYRD